ncbi:MAG: hypothetical protein PHZ00_07025 [Candidatus Peribacteraceae bacterium]|nr:hypothetical protein [Candidatus Peribacteraceae bacterium]
MKKLTFLLGTLGGAMAGYVFSNKKLRTELQNAEDAGAAAKILGRHLAADGETVAKEAKRFAEQHHLDSKIAEGKKYAQKYYESAKDEVQKYIGARSTQVVKVAKSAGKKAVKRVKKMVK